MKKKDERTLAILVFALSVARGMLQEAHNGNANKEDIARILESTSGDTMEDILGLEQSRRLSEVWDLLTEEDKAKLHGVSDTSV